VARANQATERWRQAAEPHVRADEVVSASFPEQRDELVERSAAALEQGPVWQKRWAARAERSPELPQLSAPPLGEDADA
jgi:hypothetical protein